MQEQSQNIYRLKTEQYQSVQPEVLVHPRFAWLLYYREVHNVKTVCERFKISRKTFYKWWNRFQNSGENPKSLINASRKPHNSPLATSADVITKVIEAKLQTNYGQRRLREYLIKKYDINLSEHTIWKLIKKYNVSNETDSKNTCSEKQISTGLIPGSEVILATLELEPFRKNFPYTLFSAIDKVSHLRISKIYDEASEENLIDFVNFIISKFPFKIIKLATPNEPIFNDVDKITLDNNSGSISFSSILAKNRIQHKTLSAKLFQETILFDIMKSDIENFFKVKLLLTIENGNMQLKNYLNQINNYKMSRLLGNLTPLQKIRIFSGCKKTFYFDPLV
jgi:transposase